MHFTAETILRARACHRDRCVCARSKRLTHCPAHDDRHPSLSVSDGNSGAVWKCHSGCSQEAVTNALMALGIIGRSERVTSPYIPAPRPRALTPEASEFIERMWKNSEPAYGTPVETYLRSRGITCAIPQDIHYAIGQHPSGVEMPMMLTAVRNVLSTRGVTGLHRTFLTPEGRKTDIEPVKAMLGSVMGGAVRLAPAGPILGVCEGIETALSVQQDTRLPTWAALSAGGIRGLVLPEVVQSVVIGADHDPVGLSSAYETADKWARQGLSVRVAYPPTSGQDFNDVLRLEAVAL